MVAKYACRIHGCPVISDARVCDGHRAEHERRRGTPKERNYDAGHRAERVRIKAAGIQNFRCARCGGQFDVGEAFDLGHTDDRRAWSGPEHVRCNRSAAGKAAHGPRTRYSGR